MYYISFFLLGLCLLANAEDCPSTGYTFIPNYSRCDLFFECKDGIKTIMTCPDFYAFDKNLLICVDESEVDCSYISTTETPTNQFCPESGTRYYPHLGDCTLYFLCLNGSLSLEECDAGYSWSIQEQACIFSNTADCSYTTGKSVSTTPTPPLFDCPANGTALLPNYADCTAFYKCEDGQKTAMKCPNDRNWNPDKQFCDFPSNVVCNRNVCPPTGILLLPDLSDCSSYYECVNGVKIHYHCPSGQAWNIEIDNCDDLDYVNCSYTTTTPLIRTTTPVSNVCPSSGISYLPHEYNCNKYYQCKDGEQLTKQCMDGFLWDNIRKSCRDQNTVDCGYTSPLPITTPLPSTSVPEVNANPYTGYDCTEHLDGTLLPHPTNCDKFIRCKEGKKIVESCTQGTSWNRKINSCDYSKTC